MWKMQLAEQRTLCGSQWPCLYFLHKFAVTVMATASTPLYCEISRHPCIKLRLVSHLKLMLVIAHVTHLKLMDHYHLKPLI